VTSALDVAEAALEGAAGDEAEAVVLTERSGLARFAGREVHQPTLVDNVVVSLRVVREGKVGVATTNRVEREGLRDLARRSREACDAAVQDPSFPGLAEPAEIGDVGGYDDETAAHGADEQARLAGAAIDAVDTGVYGFFTSAATELAISSSTGVAASQRMTDATVLVIAAEDGESGYAEASSWRASDLDPAAVARQAAEKAARTGGARELEPGRRRAVLEPTAVANLVEYFAYDSFGAQGLLEERSYLCGRLGERCFDPKVTIVDDSLDPSGFPKAFDFEGVPKQRVVLVDQGVARDVVWDRATAKRAGDGRTSTGHAPPTSAADMGPFPFALGVEPGDAASLDDLVAAVDDGVYVTRLHYLGIVDPREGVLTGMTRDGTFRIRGGRIAEPLVNLRFTVAVPELLADVPALGRERALVNASDFYGERYPFGVLVPAIATASFNITGIGSAPGL
jgi:predicted Zn-dependent protease